MKRHLSKNNHCKPILNFLQGNIMNTQDDEDFRFLQYCWTRGRQAAVTDRGNQITLGRKKAKNAVENAKINVAVRLVIQKCQAAILTMLHQRAHIEYVNTFQNYLKMSLKLSREILKRVTPAIERLNTKLLSTLQSRLKLSVTLRHW